MGDALVMVDKEMRTTTSGLPPEPGYENAGAPAPIDPTTGQHKAYWILSESERQKGFVRPVRTSYFHVGARPKHPTRPLTDDEREQYPSFGYVLYEIYPETESPITGKFWTQAQLGSGCGTLTTMSRAIAETYARSPNAYGATFCCHCRTHLPVGAEGEFVWADERGQKTSERVGT